jgi:predicted ester cyclase
VATHKRFVVDALCRVAAGGEAELGRHLAAAYAPDAQWRGSHPLNETQGLADIEARVWRPLLQAMPDLERRDELVLQGHYAGNDFVGTVGHYLGTFRNDWLGIPASGQAVYLRYGEVHAVAGGRIVQTTMLVDVLDLMRQAGCWPLGPSTGAEGRWPGPCGGVDGDNGALQLDSVDPEQGAISLAQTLAMHGTLGAYNEQATEGRQGLLDMPQRLHWHPRMMWYGPSGIGTTRGLDGFVDGHQMPFRLAFPRRQGGGTKHYIRIGDGNFSATGGWPSVVAWHDGPFMGSGPTGREVKMRVMDFYHHHEGLIRENWVPIDIIHLLLQMDVDVFGRMRLRLGRRGQPA